MKCDKISWVGEGCYSPNKAYGFWVYVDDGEYECPSAAVYFSTLGEFYAMVEGETENGDC